SGRQRLPRKKRPTSPVGELADRPSGTPECTDERSDTPPTHVESLSLSGEWQRYAIQAPNTSGTI
uniref:Uncharacterized protein n=1 Tax=Plectus sambesii TaxID=2011161 RepID=A0A914VLM3_9BILA